MKLLKFLIKVIIVIAVIVLIILGVITGLLYYYQDKIIFNKSKFPAGKHYEVRPNYETVVLTTDEGYKYKCWYVHSDSTSEKHGKKEKPAVVIYYLGNGSYKESYRGTYNLFSDFIGVDVFACSNRGSGDYPGEPNEKNLYKDCQMYFEYVDARIGDSAPIYGHGRSMGGATVTETVKNNIGRFHGLVLENTFTSIPRISKDFHPFLVYFMLGFKYLLKTKMDTVNKLPKMDIPTAFLISEQDKVVNPTHMRELYKVSGASKKFLFVNPKGTHDDVAVGMLEEFVDFYKDFIAQTRNYVNAKSSSDSNDNTPVLPNGAEGKESEVSTLSTAEVKPESKNLRA